MIIRGQVAHLFWGIQGHLCNNYLIFASTLCVAIRDWKPKKSRAIWASGIKNMNLFISGPYLFFLYFFLNFRYWCELILSRVIQALTKLSRESAKFQPLAAMFFFKGLSESLLEKKISWCQKCKGAQEHIIRYVKAAKR